MLAVRTGSRLRARWSDVRQGKKATGNSQECKFSLAGMFSHNLEVGLAYMGELIVG